MNSGRFLSKQRRQATRIELRQYVTPRPAGRRALSNCEQQVKICILFPRPSFPWSQSRLEPTQQLTLQVASNLETSGFSPKPTNATSSRTTRLRRGVITQACILSTKRRGRTNPLVMPELPSPSALHNGRLQFQAQTTCLRTAHRAGFEHPTAHGAGRHASKPHLHPPPNRSSRRGTL